MSIERYILQSYFIMMMNSASKPWIGGLMRATDILVLLSSKISMAQGLQKIANQIQCELLSTLLTCYLLLYIKQYHLHYILIFNMATKCLDITYHFLLRYDLLL